MSAFVRARDLAGKAVTGFLILSSVGLLGAAGYGVFSFSVLRKIAQRERQNVSAQPVAEEGSSGAAAAPAAASQGDERQ